MPEPVSLATAKAQARVLDTSEDALIGGYIKAAREIVENESGHILVQRPLTQTFDRFSSFLELHHRPIVSVGSIAYTDASGAAQTIASFVTTERRYPLRIYPAYNAWWPSIRSNTLVEVTYTAGYEPGEEPQQLIQAMMLLIAAMHSNRGSIPDETMKAVRSLCDQFRAPGL